MIDSFQLVCFKIQSAEPCVNSSSLFIVKQYSITRLCYFLFIYLSVDEQANSPHPSKAPMSNAAGVPAHRFFLLIRGFFLVWIGKPKLNHLRNHRLFENDCIMWHPLHPCLRILTLPHPHQHLLSAVFFIIDFLTNEKWNIIIVLIYIYSKTDVKLLQY